MCRKASASIWCLARVLGSRSFVWVNHVLLRANGSTLMIGDRIGDSRYLFTKSPIGGTVKVSEFGIAKTREIFINHWPWIGTPVGWGVGRLVGICVGLVIGTY